MKKIYLLIVSIFILSSCQKEEIPKIIIEEDTSKNQENLTFGLSIERQGLKDLEALPALQQILKTVKQNRGNLHNKSSFGAGYGVIIDSMQFQKIRKGDYISYTFVIQTEYQEPNHFENLVISQNGNRPVKGFLVKYDSKVFKKVKAHETYTYLKYIYPTYYTSDLSKLLYKYWMDNNGDLNKTHHEVMVLFVEAMGSSLAAWDNHRIPPPSDVNRLNYYEALSFSGDMVNTTEFSKLDSEDQDLIKLANKQEGNAVSPAESSEKSSKCP